MHKLLLAASHLLLYMIALLTKWLITMIIPVRKKLQLLTFVSFSLEFPLMGAYTCM